MNRSTITIPQMILVQTGTYQEQALRPFNVQVTEQTVNQLQSITNNGLNLGVSAVQEIASDVVTPAANVEGIVNIEQGWNSRRFRFMMKVNETHPFIPNSTTQRIFFGYTDHCDASINHLDPDMRIYFNSETTIAQTVRQTLQGPQAQAMIVGSNQIIAPVDLTSNADNTGMFSRPVSHLIRPEDVFSLGQSNLTAKRLNETGWFGSELTSVVDHRTLVGEGGSFKYSRRMDTSPTRYLSGTLNAYQHAIKENDLSNSQGLDLASADKDILFGEASSSCRNTQIHSNAFLALLKERSGYTEKGHVTWRELNYLFPELLQSQVTSVGMDNGQSIRKINHAGQSEYWTGAGSMAVATSLLAQTIPSIMMDNFFRAISFAVTNGMGPNKYVLEIHPHGTKSLIDNLDMRPYLIEFERRLSVDILNSLSRGNQIPFQISMSSDLSGDSVIDIALGNESTTRFIAPTFADSLNSPVITRNDALPGRISNDMLYLVEQVINPNGQIATTPTTSYVHPVAQATNISNINLGASNVADLGLL